MANDTLERIIAAIVAQEKDTVLDSVAGAVRDGMEPLDVVNDGLMAGLRTVGDLFADEEIFLPELVYCGEIVTDAMQRLEALIADSGRPVAKKGLCLLGTVAGDVHDIGKNLVGLLLGAAGYDVVDLGKSVATADFVQAVAGQKPQLVGLSSLLSTTMAAQQEVVTALVEAGVRSEVKVLVGGAPVTRAWADEIGADGYAEDATAAVAEADGLLGLT